MSTTTDKNMQEGNEDRNDLIGVLAGSAALAVVIAIIVILIFFLCRRKNNEDKNQGERALVEEEATNDDVLPDHLPAGDAMPANDGRNVIFIELDDSPTYRPESQAPGGTKRQSNGIHHSVMATGPNDVTALGGTRPEVNSVVQVHDPHGSHYANAEDALSHSPADDGVYNMAKPWDVEERVLSGTDGGDKEGDSGIIIDNNDLYRQKTDTADGGDMYAKVERKSHISTASRNSAFEIEEPVDPDVPGKSWDRRSVSKHD